MSNVSVGLTLREMPADLRPRERLYKYGVEALESRELLALLLGSGTRSESALGLADRLLAHFQSFDAILEASVEELTAIRGIGIAKAAQLKAAYESARRLQRQKSTEIPIRTASDAVAHVWPKMRLLQREEVWLLLLDVKNRIIGIHRVAIGHLSGAPVHPRELFKEAVRRSSYAVLIVHNHPSGDPTPSDDDIALTGRLQQAGSILGIKLLDHIIVGGETFVSLKEKGYL